MVKVNIIENRTAGIMIGKSSCRIIVTLCSESFSKVDFRSDSEMYPYLILKNNSIPKIKLNTRNTEFLILPHITKIFQILNVYDVKTYQNN